MRPDRLKSIPALECNSMMGTRVATRSGLFIAQTAFSAIGVLFSISMLATGNDASIYLPILTGIIGYWVPSPGSTFQKKVTVPNVGDVQQANTAVTAPHVTVNMEQTAV